MLKCTTFSEGKWKLRAIFSPLRCQFGIKMSSSDDSAEEPPQFTEQERNDLKDAFNAIDADHNGSIDIEETKKFMKSININPAFAPLVLEICDTNKDGQISFDEFGPYFTLLSQLDENPSCIYKYIFDKFYTDHNGLLDKN